MVRRQSVKGRIGVNVGSKAAEQIHASGIATDQEEDRRKAIPLVSADLNALRRATKVLYNSVVLLGFVRVGFESILTFIE